MPETTQRSYGRLSGLRSSLEAATVNIQELWLDHAEIVVEVGTALVTKCLVIELVTRLRATFPTSWVLAPPLILGDAKLGWLFVPRWLR